MSSTTASIPVPYVASERLAINPWIIAVTVTLATFMDLLDTAIANVALPHIAGGLAVSYDESTWVLTSYLVSNAVVLPLSAWLSRWRSLIPSRTMEYVWDVLLPGEDLPRRLTTDYLVSEGEEIAIDGREWLVERVDLTDGGNAPTGVVAVVPPNEPA